MINMVIFINSPLIVETGTQITIPNITSDALSISKYISGTLAINENLYLSDSIAYNIKNLILNDGSIVHIVNPDKYPILYFTSSNVVLLSEDEVPMTMTVETDKQCTIQYEGQLTNYSFKVIHSEAQRFKSIVNFVFALNGSIEFYDEQQHSSDNSFYIIESNTDVKTVNLQLHQPIPNLNANGSFEISLDSVDSITCFIQSQPTLQIWYLTLNYSDVDLNILFYRSNVVRINGIDIRTDVLNVLSIYSTAKNVFLSISSTLSSFPLVYIGMASDSTVFFDSSFSQISRIGNIDNINVYHTGNVLLNTTNDVIPKVTINPPINGVLYEANTKVFNVSNSTSFSLENFRSGNSLDVNCADGSYIIPQSAFLSENVHFNISQQAFIYFNYVIESLVSYYFNGGYVSVFSSDENSTSAFEFKEIHLSNSKFNGRQNTAILNVSKLVMDMNSLAEESFSYVDIKEYCIINDDVNNVRFLDSNIFRAAVTERGPRTPIIRALKGAWVIINSNAKTVKLTVDEGAALVEKFILNLTYDTPDVHLDKSWYQIAIPSSFMVMSNAKKLIMETELLNMPNILVCNTDFKPRDYVMIKHTASCTIELAFWVLLGFIIFFILISILLCFVPSNEKSQASETTDQDNFHRRFDESNNTLDLTELDSEQETKGKQRKKTIMHEDSDSQDILFNGNVYDYKRFIAGSDSSDSTQSRNTQASKRKRKMKKPKKAKKKID
ncbi:hypothetical protein GPJ56_005906 [Histomonas meleagridis]|uniref:uncharacterized protein n=1 Tax=Histomonas meleagridis TaxID=135588 RepID=UPI00355A37A2|nr:hypothetical protein GPJ56_005906 [Histomonas meleagridis]KAH0801922.1 hypothetical protein GO595_005340 [Histomonas meleagridis]